MADAEKKPAEGKEAAAEAAPAGSNKKKLIGVIGAIMLIEGVAVFGALKFLGAGADTSSAEELQVAATQQVPMIELEVVKLGAPNNRQGRPVLWNVEVYIRVAETDKDMMMAEIAANQNTIKDRFSRLLRAADPDQLEEPGLETLRRQSMFELGKVLGGDAKIVEVLIPKCTPYPIGF